VETTRSAGAKDGTERKAHPWYPAGRDGGGRTRGRSYVPPRPLDCDRTSGTRHQQGMPCCMPCWACPAGRASGSTKGLAPLSVSSHNTWRLASAGG